MSLSSFNFREVVSVQLCPKFYIFWMLHAAAVDMVLAHEKCLLAFDRNHDLANLAKQTAAASGRLRDVAEQDVL